MPVEIFTNDGTGTVTAGGTNAPAAGTVQTWTVSATIAFPAASNTATPNTVFYVTDPAAETEKMLVTNVSGATWTVTRGADGTTPVVHAANFAIVQVATSASLRAWQTPNWMDAVSQFGADPTGVADSTAAIQAALNAAQAGVVWLRPGTYLLNTTTGLLAPSGSVLRGAGFNETFITTGPSFTGAYMYRATHSCTIQDLTLSEPNATISANPATDAISFTQAGGYLNSCTVSNVHFSNINGWQIHFVDDGTSGAPTGFVFRDLGGAGAGGIGIFGAQRTLGGMFLINAGVAANGGTSTTLDGLLIQDAYDVECINSWLATGGTCTGHAIHLVGHVTNLRFAKGEYNSTSTAGSGSCNVKIEHGVNGDPSQVYFEGMTFQTGDIGVSLQGGCSDIKFAGCEFNSMNTHGVIQNSTGGNIVFDNCGFGTPGAYASNGQAGPTLHGTYYDLNWSGTGTGMVIGCIFASSIVAVSSAGVQGSVNIALSQLVTFVAPAFNGSGAAPANWYTNVPSWQALPTLQNLWTVTAGHSVGYRLTANGDVELALGLTAGTLTNGTLLFTLPAGVRPAHEFDYPLGINTSAAPTLSASGLPALAVLSTGAVEVFNLPAQTTTIFGTYLIPMGL